jgi:hypothetical protein
VVGNVPGRKPAIFNLEYEETENRDAQFRSLMMIELGIDASKLISVLNYDGMPITADNIFRQIKGKMEKEI